MTKKILLIDGNSLIFRAFFANSYKTKTLLKTSQGEPTNAVYAFINMLLGLLKKENYCDIKVAFDKGRKTFRHQKMATYKAKRQITPPELLSQLPLAQKFLEAAGIDWWATDDYEADDLIGSIVKSILQECPGVNVEILTSDKDLFQLINSQTKILWPNSGTSDLTVFDHQALNSKWGCTPEEVPQLKGLMGDPSDNLKGVPGIGEKGATELIQQYHTLENIYAHLDHLRPSLQSKLIAGKESAFFTREMATLKTDIPLNSLTFHEELKLNYPAIQEFLNRYEMVSILKRLNLTFTSPLKNSKNNIISTPKVQIINRWKPEYAAPENAIFIQNLGENYHREPLIGLAISNQHGTFYFDQPLKKQQLSFFETAPVISELDQELNHFFQNKNYQKNTYDLKKTLTLLKNAGYQFAQESFVYDMMVALYDLNPAIKATFDQQLKVIEPDSQVISDEIFFGSLKSKTPPTLQEKADFIGTKAFLIGQTKTKILETLKAADQAILYQKIDFPFIFVLFNMEQSGVQIDLEELNQQTKETKQKIQVLEAKMDQILSQKKITQFNYSSPKQLQKLLFEIFKLPDSEKGSTGREVLEKLQNEHPFVKLLLEHRKYTKIYSTYLHGFSKYIHPDKKVHTIFNQVLTSTGRISSGEPNLQNISVRDEDQKQVRRIFITTEGWEFYSFDYSQIELRVLAHLAPEPHLIEIFQNGGDVHSETARSLFNLTEHEKIDPEKRRIAKIVNFGIIYGLSAYGLAKDLAIPLSQAKSIIHNYHQSFPEIATYQKKLVDFAKNHGYVLAPSKRKRPIPELTTTNYHLKQFGERVAVNSPLQGTTADILKIAMINIDHELQKKHLKTVMVAQIHDEIILDVAPHEAAIIVPLVKDKMKSAFDDLLNLMGEKSFLTFPLEVSESHGKNWLELK